MEPMICSDEEDSLNCDQLYNRNKNGQFKQVYSNFHRHTFKNDLPTSTVELIKYWQSFGVIPTEEKGRDLLVKKFGGKRNDYFNFKLAGGRGKEYRSIVPALLHHSKHSLVFLQSVFYEFSLNRCMGSMCISLGYVKTIIKSTGPELQIKNQSLLHHRQIYQAVICAHEIYVDMFQIGGLGIENELDCGQLGKGMKNGVGRLAYNKGWLFFAGERGGRAVVTIFAKPGGGSERLDQIRETIHTRVRDGSINCVDKARAYLSYQLDHVDRNMIFARINHSKARDQGFVWKLALDEKDGLEFASDGADNFRIVDVHTQLADGFIGNFKKWCHAKRGINQRRLKAYAKEFQWRHNFRNQDLFRVWMRQFGEINELIRNGKLTVQQVMETLEWDYSAYEDVDEDESDEIYQGDADTDEDSDGVYTCTCIWVCPGCSKEMKRSSRSYHRSKCKYYQQFPGRVYDHDDLDVKCLCCAFNRRGTDKTFFRDL